MTIGFYNSRVRSDMHEAGVLIIIGGSWVYFRIWVKGVCGRVNRRTF